jgi:hypothetical protein
MNAESSTVQKSMCLPQLFSDVDVREKALPFDNVKRSKRDIETEKHVFTPVIGQLVFVLFTVC